MDNSIPRWISHSHAYPDGGVRVHFVPQPSTSWSGLKIFVGFVIIVFLIVDDMTGVGTADDGLVTAGYGIIMSGVNELNNKNVCPECGG